MVVIEFGKQQQCNSIISLRKVLMHRSKNNSNDFELRTDREYPFMTILVKDEFACVHFFENEFDCGHYAYVDQLDTKINEYTIFNMGSEDDETEISNNLVIPIKKAYMVAEDFFLTNKMSNKVKWFDL